MKIFEVTSVMPKGGIVTKLKGLGFRVKSHNKTWRSYKAWMDASSLVKLKDIKKYLNNLGIETKEIAGALHGKGFKIEKQGGNSIFVEKTLKSSKDNIL